MEEADVIDCWAVEVKLGRFVDGELSSEERVSVQSHLQECPSCRRGLHALQALSTSLAEVPVPPVPESLTAGIMARVRGQSAEASRAWGVFEFWRNWPVGMRIAASTTAAVACFIGLVLGSATQSQPSQTRTDMEWVGLAAGAPITSAYLETAR